MTKSMTKPQAPNSRGFTLLEAIVVLVITSLVAAVAIQGFGIVLGSRVSMAAAVDRMVPALLARNLVADPLSGIIPDYKERNFVFSGARQRLRGLTIRPLDGVAGAPRPFELRFAALSGGAGTALLYINDQGREIEISRWSGTTGRFYYRDVSGAWLDQWPPPRDSTAPQTPWLIRAETGQPDHPNIIAYVAGPHDRQFRIDDIMGGRTVDQ